MGGKETEGQWKPTARKVGLEVVVVAAAGLEEGLVGGALPPRLARLQVRRGRHAAETPPVRAYCCISTTLDLVRKTSKDKR